LIGSVLLSLTLLAVVADFDVIALDGQTTSGSLSALDATQLTVDTAQGPVAVPVATIAAASRKSPREGAKATAWLLLDDQTELAATQCTVAGGVAHVSLAQGGQVDIPTRNIRWVRLASKDAGDAKLSKQWSEITESKAAGDLLVIRKNGALDYLEGVLGDIDEQVCKFEVDKEVVPVKRAKIEGVVYFHSAPAELPETVGQLIGSDGSRVAWRTAALADDAIKLTTPSGVQLQWPLDQVNRLDFSTGKIAYLSDLEPETVTFVPYLGFRKDPVSVRDYFKYRRDQSYEQNPLRLDGKVYRKGLSVQSRTVLTYKLPGKFRQFRCVLGIDDSTKETGNAQVEIKADGRGLWQGEVRGSEPARELELDLAGAKRLEILVDYGADLDIGDRVDLCDARVTK